METVKKVWKGIALCTVISVPAWLVGALFPLIGGPVLAILAGMAVSALISDKDPFAAGIAFTSKKVLQAAVVLLGFGMNLSDIIRHGKQALPIIAGTIVVALLAAFLLGKTLRMPGKVSTLIGVGSAICGGSAIAAVAPVIDAEDSEIAQAISVIFLFNIAAALLFPYIGQTLGLSHSGFALFAGTAINDTSSVTAAATAWDALFGTNTLATATVVKLTRTLAIIPIVLGLTIRRARIRQEKLSLYGILRVFPLFVGLFVLASVVASLLSPPTAFTSTMKTISKFLIVLAMSAIGLNTNLIKLVRAGARPVLMGFLCWVIIAVSSLLLQFMLHIA